MKKALLALLTLICCGHLSAQSTVAGKVTDADGSALYGVNVSEKGTTQGTVTDANGAYRLNLHSNSATLLFTYVGYETTEIAVNGRSTVDVTMKDGINLGEVQVVGSRSYRR
jgi:iron complex outermembrane receptor protein